MPDQEITLRQHLVTDFVEIPQMVISPLLAGEFLQEIEQKGSICELLFEMRKGGDVFWVGVAVPQGTSDFTKAHVFFHPTVVQAGVTHASEQDYREFKGGWSGRLQRYVAMQGGQLAGARLAPLIVPFMTMGAITGNPRAYMFGDRPRETFNAILTATRDAVGEPSTNPIDAIQIGVSSFSSGITALRLFVRSFVDTGLIAEVTDFDSPWIRNEPKATTRVPGAVGRVFSQVHPPSPQEGWVTLSPGSFRDINSYRQEGPHNQIGWMTFYLASISSAIM